MPTATLLSWVLAVAPESPPPTSLSRAEVVTTDGSSILYAYDNDDLVAAEIAISADGLQASFDGLYIDADLADDGTVMAVRCGGRACSDADRQNAEAQLAVVSDILMRSEPQELRLRCALSIAATGAACAGGGPLCLVGYYLAACECMGSVTVNGKDICDEIF